MQKMSIENKEYYSKNFYQISLVNERIETISKGLERVSVNISHIGEYVPKIAPICIH